MVRAIGQRTADLLGALHGVLGQPRGFGEVASPDLDQGRYLATAMKSFSAPRSMHRSLTAAILAWAAFNCPVHASINASMMLAPNGDGHVDVGIFQFHAPVAGCPRRPRVRT